MAELVVAQSEDLSAVMRRLLDLADDPRSIVWHPDSYTVTVPDEVYAAYTGEVAAADQPLAVEPYDDELAEDLRKELGRRELSRTGLKDELIARLREDDAKGAPDGEGEGAEVEDEGYFAMTKEELQTEIDERNAARPDAPRIPRSGTNAELIARLQADDEAQAAANPEGAAEGEQEGTDG